MSPVAAIRKATGIELSLVIAICVGIAAGSTWATQISLGQTRLREEVRSMRAVLDGGTSDRWRGADMHSWVIQANREVEIWSRAAEQEMGLPPGSWKRFRFPDSHEITGGGH